MPDTESNRRNAGKSTGPVTEAGKNRSRFNAYRHGLTGRTIVPPWQDHSAYEAHCKELFDDLKPEGASDGRTGVSPLCGLKKTSAAAREANLLSLAIHERAHAIDSGDEQVDEAMAEAQALREESQILANISLYCHRIGHQRDKALGQLQKLQQARKEQRAKALKEASDLRDLHEKEGLPYNPAEYGFVFSVPEIDTYIYRESRKEQAWRSRVA